MPWLHYDIYDSDSKWIHLGDKPEDADQALDVLEDIYWNSEYLQANFERPKSIPREVVDAPPPDEIKRLITREESCIETARRNIELLERFLPTEFPRERFARDTYED